MSSEFAANVQLINAALMFRDGYIVRQSLRDAIYTFDLLSENGQVDRFSFLAAYGLLLLSAYERREENTVSAELYRNAAQHYLAADRFQSLESAVTSLPTAFRILMEQME